MALELGLYIGLNGCSLRHPENIAIIKDVIPLDRILLETGLFMDKIMTMISRCPMVPSQTDKRRSSVFP